MANWLDFKFNVFNDSLKKSLVKGEHRFCIDIIIDGYTVESISGSRKLRVTEGQHELSCILRYQCGSDLETYYSESFMFDASEEDAVFNFNLYHLTYGRNNAGFDFGPGDIPQRPAKKGGCYVATCVYGSYDCPQVWTLRRYRDYTLARTWYGRMFIHVYYSVSPIFVEKFGDKKMFKKMFTPQLDRLVEKLNQQGVLDTPYDDIEW